MASVAIDKKVLTTGQVAKICHVASRTVSKWCDSGRLKCYRIPGSQDRRITREHLIRFLRENNMPTRGITGDKIRVLSVWMDDVELPEDDFAVTTAQTTVMAGVLLERECPDCVLVELAVGRIEACQVAQAVRGDNLHRDAAVVAFGDPAIEDEEFLRHGFDLVFRGRIAGLPPVLKQLVARRRA